MNLCLNPENRYISLNVDNLIISNKNFNLILSKKDFAKLKHELLSGYEIDGMFIKLEIVVYDFCDFLVLNQEEKIYQKILFSELRKEKIEYLKYNSKVYVYFNGNILYTATYWDLVQIQNKEKINLSYIINNNFYQTLYIRNPILFLLLNRKKARCLYVCSGPFLLSQKFCVNNLFYLIKDRKREFFSRKKKYINFKSKAISSNCRICNYFHICGGSPSFNKKDCNKIKKIIKNSFIKELKK